MHITPSFRINLGILFTLGLVLSGFGPPGHADDPTLRAVEILVQLDRAPGEIQASDAGLKDLLSVGTEGSVGRGWVEVTVNVPSSVIDAAGWVGNRYGLHVIANTQLDLYGFPDDPLFSDQWSLENTGQLEGTPGADIGAREAWSTSTGVGVIVAVLDSAIHTTHPDLAANMWENSGEVSDGGDNDGNGFIDDLIGWDFVDDDNNPSTVSSETSHGTWVSGVLGAAANGIGTMGVAPHATIMPVRVCSELRHACGILDVALGIDYAVKNGANIINLSLGAMVSADDLIDDPITDAIDDAKSAGVLIVAAAGNTASNIEEDPNQVLVPGGLDFDNIVTAAATTRNDTLASFSNWGATQVDIGAPGEQILTTSGPSGYDWINGTSFSSPAVAGAAAIFLSLHPTAAPTTTIAFLLEGAREVPDLISKTVSGATLDIAATLGLSPFIDSRESIYLADIAWASAEGITRGCNPPTNDRFCPKDILTRGQMAAFLVRALGLTDQLNNPFTDDDASIFKNDIEKLAAAGITRGCNPPANTLFCPDDLVTRGQMAALLGRALGYTDDGGGDVFIDDDTSIFEADIDRLATAGITYGCNPPSNNRYCPDEPVTRGQMAAFLRRSLEL